MKRPNVKLLAYISHPIGTTIGSDLVERQDNIANVGEWARFLVMNTKWSLSCPWYMYVATLDESWRGRGLVDNMEALERCDICVQVGGHVSYHMGIERQHAARRGIPNVDLTELGFSPPWTMSETEARVLLQSKSSNAINANPRSVWMPPMNYAEIESLKDLRRRLIADADDGAMRTIDSIIVAATRR